MTVINMPPGRRRKPKATGERTELDIAEMLIARFGGNVLRYCGPLGGWFAWRGSHWNLDDREHARECAKVIARELAHEAAARLDPSTFRSAKRAGSSSGVQAILDLARSAPGIVFGEDEPDRDPWALNCLNGTLNLQTGELSPHRREDLITRVCPVAYDPSATAPAFERFLAEIQPDAEIRAYLARLCGYAAVGIVREHVIGVFWGPGANGKSVLMDVVTYVLGGYARPGPSSLIIMNAQHQPHPTDVASLVGSRLVLVHETNRGARFDSSKVKLLTGGDKLTARHMREDFFDFAPVHTLVMLTNYRPTADAADAAFWRRVQLVPFSVVIPVERRNDRLAEMLRNEAPGVLRWIVDGAREWQRTGLAPPVIVREQTDRYRANEDVIGEFLLLCCVRVAGASVKAGDLYTAYKRWCEANGHKPARGNDFAAEIVGLGIEREEARSGRIYRGLGLSAAPDEEP